MHSKLLLIDNYIANIKENILVFILVLTIDYLWYDHIAYNLYKERITNRNRNHMFFLGFLISILFLSIAITIHRSTDSKEAMIYGAIVGLVIYGFYNSMNYFYIYNWSVKLSIIDTLYGVISVSVISYLLYYFVKNN